eukprot:scaffold145506_cov16-Tisochrysis_lutea.AAC.2
MKGKNKAVVTLSVHFGMHGVHSGMHFGMHGVHFGMHFGMHGVHNGIGGITRGLQPGILTERMCTLASSWAARCVGGSKRRCRCWSCLSILRRAEDNPTLDKLGQCVSSSIDDVCSISWDTGLQYFFKDECKRAALAC